MTPLRDRLRQQNVDFSLVFKGVCSFLRKLQNPLVPVSFEAFPVVHAAERQRTTQQRNEATWLQFGIHGILRGHLQIIAKSTPATAGCTFLRCPREFLELNAHSKSALRRCPGEPC